MKTFYLVLLSLYFSVNALFAQSSSLGNWNILNLKFNYYKQLSLFGEAQLRSLKFYNIHYYEFKGAIITKLIIIYCSP